MKDFIDVLFHVVVPSITFILLIILTIVSLRFKAARDTIAVYEIDMMYKDQTSFLKICDNYRKIPIDKFSGVDQSVKNDYFDSLDYSRLDILLGDIKRSCLKPKKEEMILEMVTDILANQMATEKLAEIYANCRRQSVNGFNNERTGDFLLHIVNNISGKANQKKEAFRDEVIRILQTFVAAADSEDDEILVRADIVKFKAIFE